MKDGYACPAGTGIERRADMIQAVRNTYDKVCGKLSITGTLYHGTTAEEAERIMRNQSWLASRERVPAGSHLSDYETARNYAGPDGLVVEVESSITPESVIDINDVQDYDWFKWEEENEKDFQFGRDFDEANAMAHYVIYVLKKRVVRRNENVFAICLPAHGTKYYRVRGVKAVGLVNVA